MTHSRPQAIEICRGPPRFRIGVAAGEAASGKLQPRPGLPFVFVSDHRSVLFLSHSSDPADPTPPARESTAFLQVRASFARNPQGGRTSLSLVPDQYL